MGLDPSKLILGCGNFGGVGSLPELFGKGDDELAARSLLDAALECGIRAFDTAHSYGGGSSEAILGRWLQSLGQTATSGLRVSTKIGNPHATTKGRRPLEAQEIETQLAVSLLRLKRESAHVLFLHEPDPSTPLEETIRGLENCLQQKMFIELGLSNVDLHFVETFLSLATPKVREALKHVQNEFHYLDPGDSQALIPFLNAHNISYSAFSPLAGGLLSGKYRKGTRPPTGSRLALRPQPYLRYLDSEGFEKIDKLAAKARNVGETLPQAALRFALLHCKTVVVGVRTPEQLRGLFAPPATPLACNPNTKQILF